MSDDLNRRARQDSLRINVHEEHEVKYWTHELNVPKDELVAAVKAVGVMAVDVRKYLENVSRAPM